MLILFLEVWRCDHSVYYVVVVVVVVVVVLYAIVSPEDVANQQVNVPPSTCVCLSNKSKNHHLFLEFVMSTVCG